MKLTINETQTTYWVSWEYTLDKKSKRMITNCKIETEGFVLQTVGTATQSSEDRFVKETGRKISLKRALHTLFPGYSDETFPIMSYEEEVALNKLNRSIRTQFWNTYFSRKTFQK